MRGPLLILALAGLILHSNSNEILCASIQTQNGTRYFVPETTASGCDHSWSNSSDIVFATKDAKMDQLVAFSNITTLLTYSCYSFIKYTCSCTSEVEITSGTCITNCTETPGHPEASGSTVTPMVLPIVFSALLLIVGILCFIFRDKLCRGRRRSYAPPTGNNLDEAQIQCNGAERSVPV